MAVQRQRLAVDAEYTPSRRTQRPVCDKAINAVTTLETRIDADQRLRPEAVAGVKLLDLLLDVGRADQGERTSKSLVIVHEGLVELRPSPDSESGDVELEVLFILVSVTNIIVAIIAWYAGGALLR
jgi:hypothetical protein